MPPGSRGGCERNRKQFRRQTLKGLFHHNVQVYMDWQIFISETRHVHELSLLRGVTLHSTFCPRLLNLPLGSRLIVGAHTNLNLDPDSASFSVSAEIARPNQFGLFALFCGRQSVTSPPS